MKPMTSGSTDMSTLLPLLALPRYPSGLVVLETSPEVRTGEVGLGQGRWFMVFCDGLVCRADP